MSFEKFASEQTDQPKIVDGGGDTSRYDPDKRLRDYKTADNVESLKTDDNGKVYLDNGKLLANTEYVLNGNVYKTDDLGRIIKVDADPKLTPENIRDSKAQLEVGGKDRHPGDQGAHIVGRDMGGDGGKGNLVAMDYRVNDSDYKRMENSVKTDIQNGKDVHTQTDIRYNSDSERPDRIDVKVTVDGKETVYKFDNNLDNSLMDEVTESGKATVQSTLDDTGGKISSIKEVYNTDGVHEKSIVSVTYVNENGTNRRVQVIVNVGEVSK